MPDKNKEIMLVIRPRESKIAHNEYRLWPACEQACTWEEFRDEFRNNFKLFVSAGYRW